MTVCACGNFVKPGTACPGCGRQAPANQPVAGLATIVSVYGVAETPTPTPAPTGWMCPRCLRVNSPTVRTCPCTPAAS